MVSVRFLAGADGTLSWGVEEKLMKGLFYRGIGGPREPEILKHPGVASSAKPQPLLGLKGQQEETVLLLEPGDD